jgi:hypothetical protein
MLNNYLILFEQQNVISRGLGKYKKDSMTNFDLIGQFDANFLTEKVFDISKSF